MPGMGKHIGAIVTIFLVTTFAWMILGDDRGVREVYVMGERATPSSE